MTERQSKLIKLVNLYQKIEVSRLAELLDVSQVTIRKDLDHLEEEGLLSREHGYALIKNANDINTRLTINYDKKLEIATKDAEMVSNGETVMLESGSTCALLAEQLAKEHIVHVMQNLKKIEEKQNQEETENGKN